MLAVDAAIVQRWWPETWEAAARSDDIFTAIWLNEAGLELETEALCR